MRRALLLLLACAYPAIARADREPVLKQIDLPHSYYYREMYLPRLTSGPGAVAWTPDGRALVYAMQGSLWLQATDAWVARQITSGAGIDQEPDCSPDGRWVAYVSYAKGAIELWVLEVASGSAHALTANGAVNLEPRWSPDGRRIAFVSTMYNRRFHIFIADFAGGKLGSPIRISGETTSNLPRYYYSAYDHEISPSWSPDGRRIAFVSNQGRIYGSGGLFWMKAEPGAKAERIHDEETTWKARPDWSRDGKRIAYASYAGGQWHQLWLTTPEGGQPMPISYGEFDRTQPRWSPDGRRIAFISNQGGNTSLWIEELTGGRLTEIHAKKREYLEPVGTLVVRVRDPGGRPTAARVSVTGAKGRVLAPDDAWIHADDGWDPSLAPFERHYFHIDRGEAVLTVPAGKVAVEISKGIEHAIERFELEVKPGARAVREVKLLRLAPFSAAGERWVNADLHVHMNYGGTYRNTPERLLRQAAAEDLAIIENLIVNKEQRIPDIGYFGSPPVDSLFQSQELHSSFWGHMAVLGAKDYLLPDYSAYAGTAFASLYPSNAIFADLAHAEGGVVGYVHPYDELPAPDRDERLTHALPADVALGKVDYLEVVGFSDHRSTASVWHRLLNLGFRLPAGAGTDAMANFASLRGPVGMNRVYARVPSGGGRSVAIGDWLEALKRGRTFATNGPLLGFTLGGQPIGGEIRLGRGSHRVPFTAVLRSIVPVERFQIVCNGEVKKELPLLPSATEAVAKGTMEIETSGWCLLRADRERALYPVLDLYPYATTSPIYVTVEGAPLRAPRDAAYFAAWIDRLIRAAEAGPWNSDREKEEVLRSFREAERRFRAQ